MKLLPHLLVHTDFVCLLFVLFCFFFFSQGHATSLRVMMGGLEFPEDMGFIDSFFQVSSEQDVKVCN